MIIVDDTLVVLPPEVGHSATSSFPSFHKLSGWIISSGILVDEVMDAQVPRTEFEALESHRPLTIFGAIAWLYIRDARACTLRMTRFLRSINPTTFRCTLIEIRRLGGLHIPFLPPCADLSITNLKRRPEKRKLLESRRVGPAEPAISLSSKIHRLDPGSNEEKHGRDKTV